jgi:hypothetical protein
MQYFLFLVRFLIFFCHEVPRVAIVDDVTYDVIMTSFVDLPDKFENSYIVSHSSNHNSTSQTRQKYSFIMKIAYKIDQCDVALPSSWKITEEAFISPFFNVPYFKPRDSYVYNFADLRRRENNISRKKAKSEKRIIFILSEQNVPGPIFE